MWEAQSVSLPREGLTGIVKRVTLLQDSAYHTFP